ncbi:glycosyltransferase [Mycobacterium sp. ACS4331]|uniref:glycosyltransferase family 2 protein n=1 Tax=Mycobacterium sp. ACS4331 TaxID=1834121 RepID=UPI0008003899|nr:glycosyltransferase [Mycobacterium sp. ACS4331]OBF16548.1 hypothetical protein A5727_13500 [Mycobacterium sp. ACS4331]
MECEPAISVVIPTVGRASLRAAVDSALKQTVPPMEVIVVVDAECDPDFPDDDRVRVVRTPGRVGPGRARQLGIDSARGDLIALLDDDDRWYEDKLEKQLSAAPRDGSWILSCRYQRRSEGRKPLTIPARLIEPSESVAPYLMELRSMRRARPSLAVPTLMFPKSVSDAVPMSLSAGSIHDDPKWLMEVRRSIPDLVILQIPDCLVEVNVTAGSESHSERDRSQEYIDWGLEELESESRRLRGDYLLYSPVSSALDAGSVRGVLRSVTAGVRWGRPGVWAWIYACAALPRVALRRLRRRFSRGVGEDQ